MRTLNTRSDLRWFGSIRCSLSDFILAVGLSLLFGPVVFAQVPLGEKLKSLSFKIAYETYTNDNWEIFVMNADGSSPVNLTHSAKVHEHYPQVSPDGTKICFSIDEG